MAIQIITTDLPDGVLGVAYSQTVQTFGGQTPLVFAVDSGPLPNGVTLNTSTGVLSGTPTVAGSFNFVIEVTDDDAATDTQAYSVRMYAALNPSPDPISPATSVVVEAGSQVDFSVTGGSGNFVWSVNGGHLINPNTGLLTATGGGGNYTVTVTDTESGQVATIAIVVTSQAQFCVTGEAVDSNVSVAEDTCCEFNVECGDRLQLRIPSFHVIENGVKAPVTYGNLVQAKTGEASALQSTAGVAGATGNEVSFTRDAYYEIVTSFDMAQTANGEFGIGWSNNDVDATIASIEHAVVWYTDGSDRKVEVRHADVAEASSDFDIAQGDVVTFGVIDGELQLWINSVLVFTSAEDFASCGNVVLDIGMETANKTLGGYVSNLTWSIETSGTAAQVGTIDANGVYTSPSDPLAGVVKVLGTLNNANFFVNIRNIQPTPKTIKAQAFLSGQKPHIWVTTKKATDTEVIRIAKDGTPDAIQNPGMIYLGTLEASATFAEDVQYQNFDNDDGTYDTVISSETATLTGKFLEVRDLDKLATIMQHATKYNTVKGVTELGVGGKSCGSCDLRVVVIMEGRNCSGGWDVIYAPRVQNIGNLSLEMGRKAATGYELNFRLLPDPTRPVGKQLYSIYQMENCTNVEGGTTCD